MNGHIKVAEVVLVRNGADAGDPVFAWLSGAHAADTCESTYGSAIRRSVSFTIRLGSAMTNDRVAMWW